VGDGLGRGVGSGGAIVGVISNGDIVGVDTGDCELFETVKGILRLLPIVTLRVMVAATATATATPAAAAAAVATVEAAATGADKAAAPLDTAEAALWQACRLICCRHC